MVDQTLERLDPLSAAAARPVTTGAALLAIALPPLVLVTRGHEVVQPLWFVVAYLAVLAATALLLDRSRPTRPVWQSTSAQVFQLLLIAATIAILAYGGSISDSSAVSSSWVRAVPSARSARPARSRNSR